MTTRHPLNNPELADHTFLQDMYDDDYSGLNLNQYGVASPCRTICTVCGFVTLS